MQLHFDLRPLRPGHQRFRVYRGRECKGVSERENLLVTRDAGKMEGKTRHTGKAYCCWQIRPVVVAAFCLEQQQYAM
jgi:hypothetical protein